MCSANGSILQINYKLPTVVIQQNHIKFETSFVLVKQLTDTVILGVPFICLLYPFTTNSTSITTHKLETDIIFPFISNPDLDALNKLQHSSIHH